MIEAVVYKQQPYFNQPQIRIINRAFQSLSFRGYRQTFPVKIIQTRSKSHLNSLTSKPKVYGVVLCTKNPATNETLYALVQGRYTRKWSFPKGHSTDSETPLECALRELAEETGLKAIPDPTRYIKLVYGYYYLINVDSQLKLAPTDEHEIMDAKWVTLKEMESMELNADVSEFRKTYADMTE